MENGHPEIKNGNPVYLGVPLLLRRLLKKGGGDYYYQVNITVSLAMFSLHSLSHSMRISRSSKDLRGHPRSLHLQMNMKLPHFYSTAVVLNYCN